MAWPEARELVRVLARAATGDAAGDWLDGGRRLAGLGGRDWLLVDEAARSWAGPGPAVSGTAGWLGPGLAEPSGFVAAVTSLHVDGRVRQRAVRVLAGRPGPLAAAALAVRLLDHVPEVRAEAGRALGAEVLVREAAVVLGVLLAGRGRQHAPAALAAVRDVLLARADLERADLAALAEGLLRDGERLVRRWAFALAQEQGLLAPGRLLAAAATDPDQQVRRTAAEALLTAATPAQLRRLLGTAGVEARLVAVTRVPDALLPDDELRRLLLDRAARVREQARWRARRRGLDVAAAYRAHLASSATSPRTVAAALEGRAAVGTRDDAALFATHLRDPSAQVRAAALAGFAVHAPRAQALAAIEPVLLDPSPRVGVAAARALARLDAPTGTARAAWSSPQPWSRRAAWRLCHGAGGWDRVEADVRAAADADGELAALGQAGVRSWLASGAATTWAVLPERQRDRLRALLLTSPLAPDTVRVVAFHAGLVLPDGR